MAFATIIRKSNKGGWEAVRGGRRHQRPIATAHEARLAIDDETGEMALNFDDCDDLGPCVELAEAYGLKIGPYGDTVGLGRYDDGGLPSEYVDLLGADWDRLGREFETAQVEAWRGRTGW